jgi:peptidyl-prolyl cis-trans isomerase SurA
MLRLRLPFVAIFILVLTVPARGAVLLDRVVAVVNQDVITWSELYKAMKMDASPNVKEMTAEERDKIFKEQEAPFLESLINVRLELQQATSEGLTVGDEEVKEAIDSIKKKYSMSDAELAESLKKEGYTLDEYRKRLREQILVSKVVNRDIRSKILVTDSEVRNYAEGHRSSLEGAEGYRISQIFFKMPASAEEKSRIEEKAEAIVKRIRSGENFADLAKEYSEDPSASAGGDLGFIKKDQLMKEFRDEVARMKPGDVSSPFWSKSGLHIIRLDEKPGAGGTNVIEEQAREEVTKNLFNEKYNEWVKSLRDHAFIEVKL